LLPSFALFDIFHPCKAITKILDKQEKHKTYVLMGMQSTADKKSGCKNDRTEEIHKDSYHLFSFSPI
jgi:hypothetical protein